MVVLRELLSAGLLLTLLVLTRPVVSTEDGPGPDRIVYNASPYGSKPQPVYAPYPQRRTRGCKKTFQLCYYRGTCCDKQLECIKPVGEENFHCRNPNYSLSFK